MNTILDWIEDHPGGVALILVLIVGAGIGFLTGYKSVNPKTDITQQPSVIMAVLDPTLEPYSRMWQDEIGRRFPHSVGILVHGGDFVEGEWIVGSHLRPDQHVSTAVSIVKHYQALYPDRTVVLLACNPGHLKLGVPGVYYAHSSVWCVPDRGLTPEMFTEANKKLDIVIKLERSKTRWEEEPEVVGSIYEFNQD